MDKRYGRICPVCGKPIRKPRRGPTARFCGTACRQAYDRRKRALAERKKDESAEQTVSQLVAGRRLSEKTDAIRKRSLDAQKKTGRAKGIIRLSCMLQLKTILERKPELIENAPSDGYVAGLMDDIDRQGRSGDAERLLRHNGYTGPIPR